MVQFVKATTDPLELENLKTFLFEHGPNPWNHLPIDGVDHEFSLVATKKASALTAVDANDELLGFAIFYHPESLPDKHKQYIPADCSASAIYIAEVVVSSKAAGQGIGSKLLKLIIEEAKTSDYSIVLVDRHEENLASAGMMRKAGFVELKTFLDLERRDAGSRKTTVMGYTIASET